MTKRELKKQENFLPTIKAILKIPNVAKAKNPADKNHSGISN